MWIWKLFITLIAAHIAPVQKYSISVINVPPTLNPTLKLTRRVNKSKNKIKTHLLKQPHRYAVA